MDIKEKIINNRTKILTVIGTFLILSIISGIAYAYFGKLIINNTANAITQINTSFYTFNSTGTNSLSLTINETDLDIENATNDYSSFVSNSGGNITVTLDAKGTTPVYCTYDIIYEPINAYTASQTIYKEFTISGSSTNGEAVYETGLNSSSKVIIGKSKLIKTTSSSTTISDTWNFTLKYYNIVKPQDNIIGKTYKGNIKIENINCDYGNLSTLSAKDYILALNGGKENIQKKGTPDFSTNAITDEGMYLSADNFGDTYYFRGAVVNNWVKFGKYVKDLYRCDSYTYSNVSGSNCTKFASAGDDMYWRIVRINGDDSIRIIYSGTKLSTDTSTNNVGGDTGISTNYSSAETRCAEIVGYQYSFGYQNASGKCIVDNSTDLSSGMNCDGLYNSRAKMYVDRWYYDNFLSTTYESKITDTIYCSDRTAANARGVLPTIMAQSDWGVIGTPRNTFAYYGGLYRNSNNTPSLSCNNVDSFSVSNSIGNGSLSYPIGLLNADEVMMAGYLKSSNNYLSSPSSYWLMSPSSASSAISFLFGVAYGLLANSRVESLMNIRPVISLSKNVSLTGTGTYNDPYIVN